MELNKINNTGEFSNRPVCEDAELLTNQELQNESHDRSLSRTPVKDSRINSLLNCIHNTGTYSYLKNRAERLAYDIGQADKANGIPLMGCQVF